MAAYVNSNTQVAKGGSMKKARQEENKLDTIEEAIRHLENPATEMEEIQQSRVEWIWLKSIFQIRNTNK